MHVQNLAMPAYSRPLSRLLIVVSIAALLGACAGQSPGSSNGASGTSSSNSAPITLILGAIEPPDDPTGQGESAFKQYVEEQSGGRITIQLVQGGALGGIQDLIAQARSGSIDMTVASPDWIQENAQPLAVLTLPYLFSSQEQANTILAGDVGKQLDGITRDRAGLENLAWGNLGFSEFFNNVRAIHTIDDFKGIKLRVQNNPVHLAVWKELGTDPVVIDFGDLYQALQTHVVDGQENPISASIGAHLDEVTHFVSNTNHVLALTMWVMNEEKFASLSPDLQQILRDGAAKAVQVANAGTDKINAEGVDTLKSKGLEVNDLTPENLDAIRAKAQSVFPRFADTFGKDVLDAVLNAVKQ